MFKILRLCAIMPGAKSFYKGGLNYENDRNYSRFKNQKRGI